MEKIIQGEADGYRKALLMLKDNLPGIYADAKRLKIRMNEKQIEKIMDVVIENRQLLRNNPFAFVRFNPTKKEWEVAFDKRYV